MRFQPAIPKLADRAEPGRASGVCRKAEARRRIGEPQRAVGSEALVRIAAGPVKEALLEEARRSDADALVIGRGAQSSAGGLMRDLTYTVVRDSPYPVASV